MLVAADWTIVHWGTPTRQTENSPAQSGSPAGAFAGFDTQAGKKFGAESITFDFDRQAAHLPSERDESLYLPAALLQLIDGPSDGPQTCYLVGESQRIRRAGFA